MEAYQKAILTRKKDKEEKARFLAVEKAKKARNKAMEKAVARERKKAERAAAKADRERKKAARARERQGVAAHDDPTRIPNLRGAKSGSSNW